MAQPADLSTYPTPDDKTAALIAKHRVEIDRVKLLDSKEQMEVFQALGADPQGVKVHYQKLFDEAARLRAEDQHATIHKRQLGIASLVGGTAGAYLLMRKMTQSKIVKAFTVPIAGMASGLAGTFAGSRMFAGGIREESRKLDIEAMKAFERELAIALENRDIQAAATKAPEVPSRGTGSFVQLVTDKTALAPVTLKNLDNAAPALQAELLNSAIAKLKEQYGQDIITSGTERVMRDKYARGEAVILYGKDKTDTLEAASFSLIHKSGGGDPAVGMYMYETAPRPEKSALAAESLKAIKAKVGNDAPIFLEGSVPERPLDETRGFRSVRYDTDDYKWCDDNGRQYKWMMAGDAPPSLESMKAAIHMQRAFVVASEQETDKDFFNRALSQQINDPKIRKDYGVDESIAQAERMAVGGKMELEPLIRQVRSSQPGQISKA